MKFRGLLHPHFLDTLYFFKCKNARVCFVASKRIQSEHTVYAEFPRFNKVVGRATFLIVYVVVHPWKVFTRHFPNLVRCGACDRRNIPKVTCNKRNRVGINQVGFVWRCCDHRTGVLNPIVLIEQVVFAFAVCVGAVCHCGSLLGEKVGTIKDVRIAKFSQFHRQKKFRDQGNVPIVRRDFPVAGVVRAYCQRRKRRDRLCWLPKTQCTACSNTHPVPSFSEAFGEQRHPRKPMVIP